MPTSRGDVSVAAWTRMWTQIGSGDGSSHGEGGGLHLGTALAPAARGQLTCPSRCWSLWRLHRYELFDLSAGLGTVRASAVNCQ